MLDTFSVATFAPLLDTVFTTTIQDESLELRLIEAKEVQQFDDDKRNPFSLIFEGGDSRYISQGTVVLHHQAMPEFSVFMVPLGRDAGRNGQPVSGHKYQVIFN